MNFRKKLLLAPLQPLMDSYIWLQIWMTLVSLIIECACSLTSNIIEENADALPYVQPFCREHDERDIYVIIANTAPLFRNIPDRNVRNTMLTRSALQGM